MHLAACMRIKNEELILQDTINHLKECGVDSLWVFNDRSTDKTLDILKKSLIFVAD